MTHNDKVKLARQNKYIPTDIILEDIADTQAEINQMEIEAEYYERTPLSFPTARLDHMRAEVRRTGIKERKEFIEKLKAILEVRQRKTHETTYNKI